MADPDNLKRIAVHAKYLFLHACTHAASEHPVQRMIALHDMHNAIEWLVGGLWNFYFDTEKKPWTFMQTYDKISKEMQKLVLQREIGMLNEARNHAQHHAIAPSADALARYRGYCEAFFRESLRDALPDWEYDELYMGVLLPADLDFRVESDFFPEKHLVRLGGRAEPLDRDDSSEEQRVQISLNLRTMLIQAEKHIAQAGDNMESRWEATRMAMSILASCLYYGQLLAVEALRRGVSDGFMYSPKGEAIDPSSLQYAPLRLLKDLDMEMDFGVGLATAVHGLRSVYYEIEDMFPDEQISTLQRLVLHLRSALEPLSLGIDPKRIWRFEKLFWCATWSSPKRDRFELPSCLRDSDADSVQVAEVDQADLLWCHDLVLETLLDLAPIIEDIPMEERLLDLEEFKGAFMRTQTPVDDHVIPF